MLFSKAFKNSLKSKKPRAQQLQQCTLRQNIGGKATFQLPKKLVTSSIEITSIEQHTLYI